MSPSHSQPGLCSVPKALWDDTSMWITGPAAPTSFPPYFSSIYSNQIPVNLQISLAPLCLCWNWVWRLGPSMVHAGRGPDRCWSVTSMTGPRRSGLGAPPPHPRGTSWPAGLAVRLPKAPPAQFPGAPYLPFLASAGKLHPFVSLAEPAMPITLSLSSSKKFFSSLREGDLLHPLIFL